MVEANEGAAPAPATETLKDGTGTAGNVQVSTGNVEEGVYARVGDKSFATPEELSAWYDAERQTGRPAEAAKEGDAAAETDALSAEDEAKKTAEDDKATDKKVEVTPEQVEQIRANLKEAGGFYADPKYETAAIEFETTGDVATATRDKLATDFGVPRDMVDAFIEGQKNTRALAESQGSTQAKEFQDGLYGVVGGEAAYKEFIGWGVDALAPTDRAAYDRALGLDPTTGKVDPKGKPDQETAKALLKGFWDRFKAAGHGPGPRDLTTEAGSKPDGGTTGAVPYASREEMKKDMGSQEYQTSEAFRQKVAARVGASTF